MNSERLKCPYCNFEQVEDSSKKEIICNKCGNKYTLGEGILFYSRCRGFGFDETNNSVKKENNELEIEHEEKTIGEISKENKNNRKKYRIRLFVCLFIQIVLLIVCFRLSVKYRYDYDMQKTVDVAFSISGIVFIVLAFVGLFAFVRSLPNAQDRLIDDVAKNSPNMSENNFYYEYSNELNEIERKKEEARIKHQEEMEYQSNINKLEKEYHHYKTMANTFDKGTSKANWDNEQADLILAKIAAKKR